MGKYLCHDRFDLTFPTSLKVLLFLNFLLRRKFKPVKELQELTAQRMETKIHRGLFFICTERSRGRNLKLGHQLNQVILEVDLLIFLLHHCHHMVFVLIVADQFLYLWALCSKFQDRKNSRVKIFS